MCGKQEDLLCNALLVVVMTWTLLLKLAALRADLLMVAMVAWGAPFTTEDDSIIEAMAAHGDDRG